MNHASSYASSRRIIQVVKTNSTAVKTSPIRDRKPKNNERPTQYIRLQPMELRDTQKMVHEDPCACKENPTTTTPIV